MDHGSDKKEEKYDLNIGKKRKSGRPKNSKNKPEIEDDFVPEDRELESIVQEINENPDPTKRSLRQRSKKITSEEENSDLDDSFLNSKNEKPTLQKKSKVAISQDLDQFSDFESSVDLKTEILPENSVQVDFGVQTTKFTLPWDDMFELQNYLHFCCGICEFKSRKGIEFRTHLDENHNLQKIETIVDFKGEDEKYEIEDDQLNDVDYYCPSPHSGAVHIFPDFLKMSFISIYSITITCYCTLLSIRSNFFGIIAVTTDYGRLMKPFFIEIFNFWAWTDNLDR